MPLPCVDDLVRDPDFGGLPSAEGAVLRGRERSHSAIGARCSHVADRTEGVGHSRLGPHVRLESGARSKFRSAPTDSDLTPGWTRAPRPSGRWRGAAQASGLVEADVAFDEQPDSAASGRTHRLRCSRVCGASRARCSPRPTSRRSAPASRSRPDLHICRPRKASTFVCSSASAGTSISGPNARGLRI